MNQPVNYTAHIQFLASAAASVETPEQFKELIQDLSVQDGFGDGLSDVAQAGLINPSAALQLGLTNSGSSTLGDGPIGALLQSNDPQLWAGLHQTFNNANVVSALQNPELQQALVTALSNNDTSALSALGLDADAQAAVTNIASANILATLGTAQTVSLVPPTPPATEPTVTVVTADGTTVPLDTLVEQQGFQAVLQQQLGADHALVTRLAADPSMAQTLMRQLTGGANGPLEALNLGPAGEAAVAAQVGPRVMEALRGAQTITVTGSGDDAVVTLHNADGTVTNLEELMVREAIPAILDQTPTAGSPAFLHALHGDAEFRASFERLIEAEPGALNSMMSFMENGIGLENSSVMQDMLRNPAFREKLTEIMNEVATRDDVSFEQVAGVLQTASQGGITNYMQAFSQFRELGLETNLLTGEFAMAAGGAALGSLANTFLGPILELVDMIAEAFGYNLNLSGGLENLAGSTPFQTEVRDVDAVATVSPRTDFEAAMNARLAGVEGPFADFTQLSTHIFQADASLGDELRGLERAGMGDAFLAAINGAEDLAGAIADWRDDLASGMTTRAATVGLGG